MSWPMITVQGALSILARLESIRCGPSRALPSSVVKKTKRAGARFMEVGAYFTRSYSSRHVSSGRVSLFQAWRERDWRNSRSRLDTSRGADMEPSVQPICN